MEFEKFQLEKNYSLVTTRQETYPYLANAVVLTAAGAWAEGSISQILPAATNEVNTLTVTHTCDAAGSVIINLDGVNYTVALTPGTTGAVATQLRAASYGAWTVSGSGNDVVFTRLGKRTTATFFDVGTVTKVTATIVKTTTGTGIGDIFDICSISPTALSAAGTYQITLYKGAASNEERIATVRFAQVSNVGDITPIQIKTPKLPAGTRISASIASLAGGSETMGVSIGYNV